jgi:hypothetical protein
MSKKLKIILTYGAIISLPMILMSVLAYVFDMSQNRAFGWISILVFIVTLVLVQKSMRDSYYEGFVSYGKLFGSTLLVVVTAAVIMFIYTFLFYKVIAPDQIDKMLEMTRAKMYENEQLSSAQIKQSIEFMTKYVMTKYVMTPISLSLTTLITTFGQGLAFALITSIFMKKNQDGFTEAMKGIEDSEETLVEETNE